MDTVEEKERGGSTYCGPGCVCSYSCTGTFLPNLLHTSLLTSCYSLVTPRTFPSNMGSFVSHTDLGSRAKVLILSVKMPLWCICAFAGVGHCGYRAEAKKGAHWPESLGSSPGSLSEPPVQRLLPDHKGELGSNSLLDIHIYMLKFILLDIILLSEVKKLY